MKEYTVKKMKLLKANPYTFKITKNKLYFTIEFKETFWTAYQAGISPRKILTDLGYDYTLYISYQRYRHQMLDDSNSGFHDP